MIAFGGAHNLIDINVYYRLSLVAATFAATTILVIIERSRLNYFSIMKLGHSTILSYFAMGHQQNKLI